MKLPNKTLKFFNDINDGIDYKIVCQALGLSIINIILIGLTFFEWTFGCFSALNNIRIVILSIASTILSTLIIFILWETVGRRSFAVDVLKLADISANLSESGVMYVFSDFKHIEWHEELKYAKKVVAVFSYATTWINNNQQMLEKIIDKGNDGTITVYLPNYANESALTQMALRFDSTNEKVKQKIQESIVTLRKLGATIYLYNGAFQSSYYLVDKVGFMAFFNHKKEKSFVPAIKFAEGGTMYDYVKSEISAIKENSIKFEGEC